MRRQLAVLAAAITAMVVLAFCVPLALVVRVVANDRAVHAGELEARSLAAVLAGSRDPAIVGPIVEQADAGSPRPATVFLPDGTVLGDTTPAGPELAEARTGRSFTAEIASGRAVLVPVQGSGGTAVVRVLVSNAQLEQGVYRAWLLLALVGVALVLLAMLLADRLGRSLVRPVEALRRVTQRLREGDRNARATGEGPREIVEVSQEVNRLADRIDQLLLAEREGAADLSHRLRTPLTALRLDVEQLDEGDDRGRLLGEVDALETAVDNLIRTARGTPVTSAPTTVDLVAASRARLAFWSVLAGHQGREVTVTLPSGPLPVAVPGEELDAAIDALVGNVFAHTPDGSGFTVEVADRGGHPTFAITDQGNGFDMDALGDRGTSSAGSTGLGLDIARRTAEAAGGRLQVDRPTDAGARVELVLG